MDSFGDLYTLAFKNLSSLFLPIVLGMFATTLFFDEHKNDTMKELLIIPITKAQLYFSKVAVVILMSVGLCLITFLLCVVGGLIAGGFPDLNAQTLMDAGGALYATGCRILLFKCQRNRCGPHYVLQMDSVQLYPVDHPTGSAGDVVYHADV